MGKNELDQAYGYALLFLAIIAVARILFFLSLLLFVIIGIVVLISVFSGDEVGSLSLYVLVGSFLVMIITFGIGIMFPVSSTGTLLIDTSNSVVYVKETVDDAKTTIYVTLLESMAFTFEGYYENYTIIEKRPLNEPYNFTWYENKTYYYLQTLEGENFSEKKFENATLIASSFRTANNELCAKECVFYGQAINRQHNFTTNVNLTYNLAVIDQWGNNTINRTQKVTRLELPFREGTEIKTNKIKSTTKELFKVKLIPDSTYVGYNRNNNTVQLNYTLEELNSEIRLNKTLVNKPIQKQRYVVTSNLYYLLVWFAKHS